MEKSIIKNIAILLFFIMFIYSGFSKIINFTKKVSTLQIKTNLPHYINVMGIICVILLEVIGTIILIIHQFNPNIIPTYIAKYIYIIYMIFMIVVTILYHPPSKAMIPFLSNLTTFGAFIYIYADKFT